MVRIIQSILRRLPIVSWQSPKPIQDRPAPRGRSFSSLADCQRQLEADTTELQSRRLLEAQLAEQLGTREQATLPGECWVCRERRKFTYDLKYSDGVHINWRERLVCPRCGLNNRLRLCVQVTERTIPRDAAMYLTEQVTPLAKRLARRYRKLERSEYLGPGRASGSIDKGGLHHQDVTALSFEDGSFDCVLSFDVLEHVPDYRTALTEFRRILRESGKLILSVPFCLLAEKNVVRAKLMASGEIEHLLPPEYHSDPVAPDGGAFATTTSSGSC